MYHYFNPSLTTAEYFFSRRPKKTLTNLDIIFIAFPHQVLKRKDYAIVMWYYELC